MTQCNVLYYSPVFEGPSLKDGIFIMYSYVYFYFQHKSLHMSQPQLMLNEKKNKLMHGYPLSLSSNVLMEPFCGRLF